MKLDASEPTEFESLVEEPQDSEVKKLLTVYEQRGIEIGRKEGVAQGVVLGKQQTLLSQMSLKFGSVPMKIQTRVKARADVEELDILAGRIVVAKSLDEMSLAENLSAQFLTRQPLHIV